MDVAQLLLFILPAYIANATPVLFGGGMPVDFRRKFIDGERLLGDGKPGEDCLLDSASEASPAWLNHNHAHLQFCLFRSVA